MDSDDLRCVAFVGWLSFGVALVIALGLRSDRQTWVNKASLLESGYTNVEMSDSDFKAKLNGNEVSGVFINGKAFFNK